MTIWQITHAALAGLGVPIAQSVYISDVSGQLPNLFVTYKLISSPVVQEADNIVTERRYRMQVSTYSRTGMTDMPDVRAAMLAADFIEGPFVELPYDEKTRHYGLAQDFFFLKK